MTLVRAASPKPKKGEYWLAKKKLAAERKAREKAAMDAAKRRDWIACHGCRWPTCEHRAKEPRLEPAHVFEHRGMGGDRTDTSERTTRELIMGLCFICHGRLDDGDADVQALTDRMADGPCAFFVRDPETGEMVHVASEKAIGISEARR